MARFVRKRKDVKRDPGDTGDLSVDGDTGDPADSELSDEAEKGAAATAVAVDDPPEAESVAQSDDDGDVSDDDAASSQDAEVRTW